MTNLFSNKKGVVKIPESAVEGATVLPNREDGSTGLQIALHPGKKPHKPLKGGSLISMELMGKEWPAIVLTYSPPGQQKTYRGKDMDLVDERPTSATIIATLLEPN